MTVRTLYPVNQYVGTLEPGWLDVIQTPDPFGSVTDDSDTTYSSIAADFLGGSQKSALLSCDFAMTPDATFNPAFLAMQIRARNGTVDPANLGGWTIQTLYHRADGSAPNAYDSRGQRRDPGPQQLAPLLEGNAATDWFNFYYLSSDPTDPAAPDAYTWLQIGPDPSALGYVGGTARDALLGGGIRFSIFVYEQDNLQARQDFLDIFEVRMLVADATPTVTHAPPLRQWPRSDGLGASSARRLWPLSPSIQASNRRVGGYL